MKSVFQYFVFASVFLLTACADNGVSHDDDDGLLTARIEFEEDHLATLEEVEIDVYIENSVGDFVSDMRSVMLQHRVHDHQDWEDIQVELHGDHYSAIHQFMTSGDHEFRVVGARHEGDSEQVLFEMNDHMEIERAHMEMSGFLIAYEHEGGEIHEGDTVDLSFWIERMNNVGDGHGVGAGMMTGLSASITCEESDGSTETHDATEMEDGRYGSQHTFSSAGDAMMTVEFMSGGMMQRASFQVPISESH